MCDARCISVAAQRLEYARSPSYIIVNQRGEPDPNGDWVRKPSGTFIKLEPVCVDGGQCKQYEIPKDVVTDEVMSTLDAVLSRYQDKQ